MKYNTRLWWEDEMNTGWWQLSEVQRCDQRETVVACCTNLSVSVQIGLSVPTPEQDGHRLTWLSDNPGTQISKISTCQREPREILKISTRDKDCLVWYQHVSILKVKPNIILILIFLYQHWKILQILRKWVWSLFLCFEFKCFQILTRVSWDLFSGASVHFSY